MALAYAQSRAKEEETQTMAALLSGAVDGAASTDPGGKASQLPSGYVVIFTQVLPDGMGDLIFGESAVRELLQIGPVVWLRCYTNEESREPGERLVADQASAACLNVVCSSREGLYGVIGIAALRDIWVGAAQRFLAPWIFGLSAHEESFLELAHSTGKSFFALTEYGRGMGNIHTYTGGLGAMIPTGWTVDGAPGGIFRSILSIPRTTTDWRHAIAEHCAVAAEVASVRLWWFYSRKDDEKKHDFRFLETDKVAKVIPITKEGGIALGNEKTSGEKLADQLFEAAKDPNFKPNTDVACAELSGGCAAQLSQFIWGMLFDPDYVALSVGEQPVARHPPIDIIVAPNILTQQRKACGGHVAAARITHLDLVDSGGARQSAPLERINRHLYICSTRVPRIEMRTFLEQCEQRVFTTGDQSLAEAILMDKIPCVKPDAKVSQWQAALITKATGGVEAMTDLGHELRCLVTDEVAQDHARRASELRSREIEKKMVAQLGSSPEAWNPTQQVLARAGMLG